MNCVGHLSAVLAVVLASQICAAEPQMQSLGNSSRPKKLIETGWDTPDTAYLRKNLAEMEKQPFNGLVIQAVGWSEPGKAFRLYEVCTKEPWQEAWFQNCIDDLKACPFRQFTDNFVLVEAIPGNVDWFDDAGWKNVIEHWRIAAAIARKGGVKGILFDPEPYRHPYSQFRYDKQPQHAMHSFDEYMTKTRQRGRELMQVLAAEYPDITIFTYRMNCANIQALGHADPRSLLAGAMYGLYPAFIDGWLDVVPPTVKLVDGCENAYMFINRDQYLEQAASIKGGCQELVSPANRAKYRAQVQVSFGVYLDAYCSNPKTSPYVVEGQQGRSRVQQLRVNVADALDVADEYVWIYGERYYWWPAAKRQSWMPPEAFTKSWPEVLPGCDAALASAVNPTEFARKQIEQMRREGRLVNLARNGDFSSEKAPANDNAASDWKTGGAPAGWHTWQEDTSKGVFTWDREIGAAGKGSARAAGVSGGCFIQSYRVKPGETYVVTAVRKLQGAGEALLNVSWQTAEGKWTTEPHGPLVPAVGPRGDWAEMFGSAKVPANAGKLVLLLSVTGQASAQDVAWFGDVGVYKLSD